MKTRSKALYQYLLQADVLSGPEEAIALAKLKYRKQYKRNWKKKERPRKEIRIDFTLKQFDGIKRQATLCGLKPTPYARKAILASVECGARPLPDEALSRAFQLTGMAVIALQRQAKPLAEIRSMLEEAEQLLLTIIKNLH